jgi:hypothetical protein
VKEQEIVIRDPLPGDFPVVVVWADPHEDEYTYWLSYGDFETAKDAAEGVQAATGDFAEAVRGPDDFEPSRVRGNGAENAR